MSTAKVEPNKGLGAGEPEFVFSSKMMGINGLVTDMPFLDISGSGDIQIRLAKDGKILWVNLDGFCTLRICKIKGKIYIEDERRLDMIPD